MIWAAIVVVMVVTVYGVAQRAGGGASGAQEGILATLPAVLVYLFALVLQDHFRWPQFLTLFAIIPLLWTYFRPPSPRERRIVLKQMGLPEESEGPLYFKCQFSRTLPWCEEQETAKVIFAAHGLEARIIIPFAYAAGLYTCQITHDGVIELHNGQSVYVVSSADLDWAKQTAWFGKMIQSLPSRSVID